MGLRDGGVEPVGRQVWRAGELELGGKEGFGNLGPYNLFRGLE